MEEKFLRDTFVYGNEFWEFYNSQSLSVQKKIDWTIGLVRSLRVIPEKFFKHIEGTDGLYEIRVKFGSDIFRIFCFFDKGRLIILLNGFRKKSQKTPLGEIERALSLRRKYYEEK